MWWFSLKITAFLAHAQQIEEKLFTLKKNKDEEQFCEVAYIIFSLWGYHVVIFRQLNTF